jgi:glycosyltransferase involved in cell wall biosynthesis
MAMPKIAVITAAYNCAAFIKDCIDSVAAQNYPHECLKHFICDDCSTDNTVEVATRALAGSPIESYILQMEKNSRQGAARNACIRAAWDWADAFVILDADDTKYPDFTIEHVNAWMSDPNAIQICYSDYHIYDEATGLSTYEYKFAYDAQRLLRECIVSSGALVSKAVFAKCGLYHEDTSPAEDYGLWLRASNFFLMKHIPKALWRYRVHGDNSTNAKNAQRIQEAHKLMAQRYQEWLQNPIGYQP